MTNQLKPPFPYFGGKSIIASRVWELFGQVPNYVEPFAGSLAVLLNRPAPITGSETVNDYSCHLINAWRAIAAAPEALAELCVGPVAEVNTEAQHYQLVSGELALRDRLGDPAYFDIVLAAWWIKGANEWIGSGFCDGTGPWQWSRDGGWAKRNAGRGVNRQLPHLGGGKGVNRQLPHLGGAGTGEYEQRVAFVREWLCALRDRLCQVRIACGDWSRVLGPTPTVKLGPTAVFLDPPYDGTEYVYAKDSAPISAQVRKWCIENGNNLKLRIILCGRGEEHDELLAIGWSKENWSASKGYSKTAERHTEAMWFNFAKDDNQFDIFE